MIILLSLNSFSITLNLAFIIVAVSPNTPSADTAQVTTLSSLFLGMSLNPIPGMSGFSCTSLPFQVDGLKGLGKSVNTITAVKPIAKAPRVKNFVHIELYAVLYYFSLFSCCSKYWSLPVLYL